MGALLIDIFKTLINRKIMATWINSEWPFIVYQVFVRIFQFTSSFSDMS